MQSQLISLYLSPIGPGPMEVDGAKQALEYGAMAEDMEE